VDKKRAMGSKKRRFCLKDFGKLFKLDLGSFSNWFDGTIYSPG